MGGAGHSPLPGPFPSINQQSGMKISRTRNKQMPRDEQAQFLMGITACSRKGFAAKTL